MNFYEAQEFIKKIFTNEKISFEFDQECLRKLEIIFLNGKMIPFIHVEYHQVKVLRDGYDPIYFEIIPHRIVKEWEECKNFI